MEPFSLLSSDLHCVVRQRRDVTCSSPRAMGNAAGLGGGVQTARACAESGDAQLENSLNEAKQGESVSCESVK